MYGFTWEYTLQGQISRGGVRIVGGRVRQSCQVLISEGVCTPPYRNIPLRGSSVYILLVSSERIEFFW